jgi:hypothetical protein
MKLTKPLGTWTTLVVDPSKHPEVIDIAEGVLMTTVFGDQVSSEFIPREEFEDFNREGFEALLGKSAS